MTSLEDRLRSSLSHCPAPVADGLAGRILIRVEVARKRRRVAALTSAALAVAAAAVAVGLAASGGSSLVSSVPAKGGRQIITASPAPQLPATEFKSGQRVWVACLRDHGVKVSDSSINSGVNVDPDPALQAQREACAGLQPGVLDLTHHGGGGDTPAPGTEVVHHLAAPVVAYGPGSATIYVGPAPTGADQLYLTFTCLTAGTFTFADGANGTCSAQDAANGQGATQYSLHMAPGATTTTITTSRTARWRLSATWSSTESVPYAINEHGQTYGSGAGPGPGPDLIAVEAGNGRTGYVYRDQLNAGDNETLADVQKRMASGHPAGPSSIPMYESDGRTRIGSFRLD
jgi:hypothetical protein